MAQNREYPIGEGDYLVAPDERENDEETLTKDHVKGEKVGHIPRDRHLIDGGHRARGKEDTGPAGQGELPSESPEFPWLPDEQYSDENMPHNEGETGPDPKPDVDRWAVKPKKSL